MKMLVDNVAVQAVEACLLSQLPSIISPTSIMKMTDDAVSRIAAEPEGNQALREQLDRKLAGKPLRSSLLFQSLCTVQYDFMTQMLTQTLPIVLQSGLDICKRYAGGPRSTTVYLSKLPIDRSSQGISSTSAGNSEKGSKVSIVRV